MKETISAVIPTYNERESIDGIIRTIRDEVYPLEEIIVVDDNSPDETWKVVEEIYKRNSAVKLLRRLKEKGLPSALSQGIAATQGDVVLWLDADFYSLPLKLQEFVKSLDSCDIAVLSRYVPGGKDSRNEKMRVIASRFYNLLARAFLGTRTRDLTSGYALVRKKVFERIRLGGVYGEYFVRFIHHAERQGFKIKEVPYVCFSREKGKSKTSSSLLTFFTLCLIYTAAILRTKFAKYEKDK